MNTCTIQLQRPGQRACRGFLSFEASTVLTWLAVYVWTGGVLGQAYQRPLLGAAVGVVVGLAIVIPLGISSHYGGFQGVVGMLGVPALIAMSFVTGETRLWLAAVSCCLPLVALAKSAWESFVAARREGSGDGK